MDDQEALDLEIAFQEAADENDREVEANFANLEGGQGGDGEIHNCLGGYEYEFVDGINCANKLKRNQDGEEWRDSIFTSWYKSV